MYSSRSLLGHFHEPPQIGSCRRALDEQMRVIGHDAIGKNCEFLESRSTPELLERPSHDVAIDKDLLALVGAKGQEVAGAADVIESGQTLRSRHNDSGRRKRGT